MIQLLTAEFLYSVRGLFLLAGLIIPACLIYVQASETAGLSTMLLPLTVGIILQPVVLRSMEQRDRHHILLPLQCRMIALARLLVFVTPVVGFYGLYLAGHFLFRSLSAEWNHEMFDLMMFRV